MSEYTPEKTEKAEWLIQSLDLSVTTDQLFRIAPGGRLAFEAAYLDYVLQGIDETTARISRIRKDLLKESAPVDASGLQAGRLMETEAKVTAALQKEDFAAAEASLEKHRALLKTIREEIAEKKKLDLERRGCISLPQEAQEGTGFAAQRKTLEQADAVMQSALEGDDLEGARAALVDLKKARLVIDRTLFSGKVGAIRRDPRAKDHQARLEELLKTQAGALGLKTDSNESFFDQALEKLREASDKGEAEEGESYVQAQALIDLLKNKLDEAELVQSIVVSSSGADRLAPGAKLTMQAEITPKNAKDATVTWSVADPKLATIDAKTGVLTGVGTKGGQIEVIATANDSGHALGKGFVALVPWVESIDIGTSSYFLRIGGTIQLTSTVQPFGASGDVRWQMNTSAKYLKIEKSGLVSCAQPPPHLPEARKSIIVTAVALDGSGCSTRIEIPIFKPVSEIKISAPSREVKPGESLQLTAEVSPKGEAAEEVTWSVDETEMATIDANGLLTPTGTRGGQLTVTATAQDGSNKYSGWRVRVAMDINQVTLNAPPAAIQLGQTPTLRATLDPDNTGHRIGWSVDDESIATISKDGKLEPVQAGSVTVTALAIGTQVSASSVIQVNDINPAANLAGSDWNTILPMITRHVTRIKLDSEYITENGKKRLQNQLGQWREDIEAGRAVTFQQIRTRLVELRNIFYQPTHGQWLELAGFSPTGTGCYLCDKATIPLGGKNRDIHLTMFVQDDPGIPLGNAFATLRNQVFQPDAGHTSCHATCEIKGMDKAEVKVYVSGKPHWPPSDALDFMAGQGIYLNTARPIVTNWLQGRYQAARVALLAAYNAVANLI